MMAWRFTASDSCFVHASIFKDNGLQFYPLYTLISLGFLTAAAGNHAIQFWQLSSRSLVRLQESYCLLNKKVQIQPLYVFCPLTFYPSPCLEQRHDAGGEVIPCSRCCRCSAHNLLILTVPVFTMGFLPKAPVALYPRGYRIMLSRHVAGWKCQSQWPWEQPSMKMEIGT